MKREDILRMAREAKVFIPRGLQEAVALQELQRFAALVAAAEREACAKVCEQTYPTTLDGDLPCYETPAECAVAIRARSQA